MYPNNLNYEMISKALSASLETLKNESPASDTALQELEKARMEMYQALSVSGFSRVI
nr:hypothetical protein [Neobacillus sp. Marseille-Q6967]